MNVLVVGFGAVPFGSSRLPLGSLNKYKIKENAARVRG